MHTNGASKQRRISDKSSQSNHNSRFPQDGKHDTLGELPIASECQIGRLANSKVIFTRPWHCLVTERVTDVASIHIHVHGRVCYRTVVVIFLTYSTTAFSPTALLHFSHVSNISCFTAPTTFHIYDRDGIAK